jgi:hypothetical protein
VFSFWNQVSDNFGRIRQAGRVTPAREERIANHVWTLEEIVGLLDEDSK